MTHTRTQVAVDPADGSIKDLKFDPETYMDGKLKKIYDLYDEEEATKAYRDLTEPYNLRPSTWRTRRMYNRQPTGLKEAEGGLRMKGLFDRIEGEVEQRKKTEEALAEAMKQLREIKDMMAK